MKGLIATTIFIWWIIDETLGVKEKWNKYIWSPIREIKATEEITE